ncbi:MAG: tripartite tricarboxylate transporter substrate binding protein [Burkholderiales bacterium]|nr:tripartite tricarboxylate transporter substrate binding protein [Burkholderiales bacterium]MDP2400038.1 tripartite tricarboxylate transporter substrate binding protein [Burkholderiales bacterium]
MKKFNGLIVGLGLLVAAAPVLAQNWPARTVRIIVPYAAGGNTDYTARTVAAKVSEMWGQQVIVDNRPGGATNIGSELAATAAPDGYTLFMGGASNAINMTLYAKPPYITARDFQPVIWCVQGAALLAAHPSLPAKNVKELIALAKSRPGQLNYGHAGLGSSNHMAGELLKYMAGINIVHVPYKGNTPSITDAISGNVEMVFSGVPALVPHIKSGRLRPIAISSLERFPAVPEIPTFHESGVKGYEASNWFGLMAPSKVSRDIVNKINADVNKALDMKDVRERFDRDGLITKGGTIEEFGKFIRAETEKYANVIKKAGIKQL